MGASVLYTNILGALGKEGSQQNEYIMKCMMRVTHLIEADLMQHAGLLVPQLVVKLQEVSKNPTKPHYVHYLIETFSPYSKKFFKMRLTVLYHTSSKPSLFCWK